MDMQFYWLRGRHRQQKLYVHWNKGSLTKADYPTKHHSIKHHIQVLPKYVCNIAQNNKPYIKGVLISNYQYQYILLICTDEGCTNSYLIFPDGGCNNSYLICPDGGCAIS